MCCCLLQKITVQKRKRKINSERTKKRYECVKGTVSKRRSSNTIKRYKVSLIFKEFSKRKKKKYLYLATSVFAISKCNFARNDLKLCESTSSSDVAAILNAPVFVKKVEEGSMKTVIYVRFTSINDGAVQNKHF